MSIKALSIIALIGLLAGCASPDGQMNNTGTGALIGGAGGAAIGAIADRRDPGLGALIGGALGVVTGGLVGHSMDEQQREWLRAQAPETYVRVQQGQPLSVADVKALAKAGVSDEVVITQIQNSRTAFHLSADDIIDLHDAGVSDNVVDYLISTANMPGAPVTTTVVEAPPPPMQTEVVIASPGPEYVWVDGEWEWSGVTWVWAGGHWGLPPYPHGVWEHGDWHHGPRGWSHAPGHWR